MESEGQMTIQERPPEGQFEREDERDRKEEASASEYPEVFEDRLGDHTMARYRHFRHVVEQLEEEKMGQELFGLLLDAESMRDDIRAYEKETVLLLRLAQTGNLVRQLRRLHVLLDSAAASHGIEADCEPFQWSKWENALNEERVGRSAWYRHELEQANQGDKNTLIQMEISCANAEEVMTMLKGTFDEYGPDSDLDDANGLMPDELHAIKMAFDLLTVDSNSVVMALPTWFVLPFEYTATFGLSMWGNDRFDPNHRDEERFIREASGWSALNHPHVAKFVGACHVGDEWFVAHECVRPMSEYAAFVEGDRKKVWERIYEVGLAIQYLFERGFSCPKVTIEQLYCAQYEDRAVILGVHLHEWARNNVVETTGDLEFKNTRAALFDDASVESLVVAIANIFNCMAYMGDSKTPVDAQSVIEEYNSKASVPMTTISCLQNHEWLLLKRLKEDTNGVFFRVVNVLGELVQLHGHSGNVEYILTSGCQFETSTQVKDVKVTLMSETIGQLFSICQEATSGTDEPLCLLLSRFDNIINQLQHKWEDVSDRPTVLKSVVHLCNMLRQFSCFAQQQAQLISVCHSQSASVFLSASIAYSQQVVQQLNPGRVFSLHSKIDQFLVLHRLSSSSQVHCWRQAWKDTFQATVPPSVGDTNRSLDMENALTLGSNYLSRWYIPREQIDFEEHDWLGKGAFGSVHKGKWFETPVVVKLVKQQSTTEAQFRKEADVWFSLNHINVVKMYGACDAVDLFFVCEYASGGDLDKYLYRQGRDPYLMWYCLLNAALGLQYLHSKGIVHADLKANNILVGGDGVAKLTDFGLSVRAKDPAGAKAGALGAYQWKAPECLSGSKATFASDVYSFAMVILEVMKGSCPWGEDMDNSVLKYLVVKKGQLPPRPENIGDSEWSLIERMCTKNPEERVAIDAVVVHLSSLLQKLDQDQLWFGGVSQPKTFKNRVVSRNGMLLSLIDLVKSQNRRITDFVGRQIVSISESRDGPSNRREVDAVISMLIDGTGRDKASAAHCIGVLARKNHRIIASGNAVTTLISMIATGTYEQQTQAAFAISELSSRTDLSGVVLSANGIEAIIKLIRKPLLIFVSIENRQKFGARALANLSMWADISAAVLAANGINPLFQLVREGNDDQKSAAAWTLANLSRWADISSSILAVEGVRTLVQLTKNGTNNQKCAAAQSFANMAMWANINNPMRTANGIDSLFQLVREGDGHQKSAAALALANMASWPGISRSVCEVNGVDSLLQLIRNGTSDQKSASTRALRGISAWGLEDVIESVIGANGITLLLQLVREGNDHQKREAASVLANIASRTDISAFVMAANGVDSLVQLVREGNDDQKLESTRVLINLSNHANITPAVMAADGICAIVQLVRNGTDGQKMQASRLLGNLSNSADFSSAILATDGLDALVQLVREGTVGPQHVAAATLAYLAKSSDVSRQISSTGGVEPLVLMLSTPNDIGKREAARALANIAHWTDISGVVMSHGGVQILSDLLRCGVDDLKSLAVLVFMNLGRRANIREALESAGGIVPLMDLARNGTKEQRELAKRTCKSMRLKPSRSPATSRQAQYRTDFP